MIRTRAPHLLRPLLLGVALLAAGLLARPALAEDPQGGDDVGAKLKAQMEKIIELMRQNEKALLDLSTGKNATTVKPEVPVPPGQERPGASGSSNGEPSAGQGQQGQGAPAGTGEGAARELEKLIRHQRSTASSIPTELEELIRMIPMRQGGGSSSGGPAKPEGSQDKQNQPRKMQKDLADKDNPDKGQGKKPESPRDQNDKPQDKAHPESPEKPRSDQSAAYEAWLAELPAQVREYVVNGDFAKVPQEYRALVDRYMKFLRREMGKQPANGD